MIESPTESPHKPELLPTRMLSTKVAQHHLQRLAIVYVRQSSTKQVEENIESTQMQYRLADRATALGWSCHRIEVIDDDLGVSGTSIEGRAGFQRLLAEVSMEHVGIVLGIETSRLARSCRDWHQLLELCSSFGTLLADADGVYDPRDHNDRLLLGLKGTMSEAELHVLRGRLRAGQLNKARRGEYFTHAPIGYVRADSTLVKDPDDQARGVVQLIFDKFVELGSVSGVLRYLRRHDIKLGVRDHRGANRGQLQWRSATHPTLVNILHHPVYAGAYVYGRRQTNPRKVVPGQPGKGRRWAKLEDWNVLLKDHLPAYICWEQWENNQRKLRENSARYRMGGAVRGTSLLAGRVICGRCGHRMSISYSGQSKARFTCDMSRNHWGDSQCQSFNARSLDELLQRQLLVALEPASIELSLQAANNLEADRRKVEDHHRRTIDRATYQSELARRRYDEVDPANRLVASELERRWEAALIEQRRAEEELQRIRQQQPTRLTKEELSQIKSLSLDIPALWNAESTSGKDRQTILRTLVQQIIVAVVGDTERMEVTIHWCGGFESCHEITRAVGKFEKLESSATIKLRIIQLKRRGHTHQGVADELNAAGYRAPSGGCFTRSIMSQLCRMFTEQSATLSAIGGYESYWTMSLLAKRLNLSTSTLRNWQSRGWVESARSGHRWVLRAGPKNLQRLEQLAEHQRNGNRPPSADLTRPCQEQ